MRFVALDFGHWHASGREVHGEDADDPASRRLDREGPPGAETVPFCQPLPGGPSRVLPDIGADDRLSREGAKAAARRIGPNLEKRGAFGAGCEYADDMPKRAAGAVGHVEGASHPVGDLLGLAAAQDLGHGIQRGAVDGGLERVLLAAQDRFPLAQVLLGAPACFRAEIKPESTAQAAGALLREIRDARAACRPDRLVNGTNPELDRHDA
nr:hypothetical protein [Falsiroseomonas tokyonensis]